MVFLSLISVANSLRANLIFWQLFFVYALDIYPRRDIRRLNEYAYSARSAGLCAGMGFHTAVLTVIAGLSSSSRISHSRRKYT